MTTKNLYIGWDVGAWHCKPAPNKSCDALCIIQGNKEDGFEIIGHTRQSLSESVNKLFLKETTLDELLHQWVRLCVEESQLSNEQLIELVKNSKITLAIDAVLGWSIGLRNLLIPKKWKGGRLFNKKEIESPLLFRETERIISKDGHNPKSVVTERIGSQSTKGLAFIRSSCFKNGFGRWKSKNRKITIIETYPAACYTSKSFWSFVGKLKFKQLYKTETPEGDSFDAVICALIALIYCTKPKEVTIHRPNFSQRKFMSEGWIFAPKKEHDDFDKRDVNKCVEPNNGPNKQFENAASDFFKKAEEKQTNNKNNHRHRQGNP